MISKAEFGQNQEKNQNKERGIRVRIITPDKILFDENCQMAVVPAANGEIGFMANHENMMAKLIEGEIKIYETDQKIIKTFLISGGYAKIQNEGHLLIIAEQITN